MKISVRGPIIPSSNQWIYDWFGMDATSPSKITSQLENVPDGEDIEVEVNSGGGSVFDASEIYTILKDHPSNVTVKILGLAASAASFIAMAGDKVLMAPTAQMMIHNASTISSGDYRDMNHTAEFLKGVNQSIANAYRIKSGKSDEELLSMMDNETWMTAERAKQHGLIDAVMFDTSGDVQVVANADAGMLPQQIIDKMRNEFNSVNQPTPSNSINSIAATAKVEPDNHTASNQTNDGEETEVNYEDLKNNHPELFKQIRNEGYADGVTAENTRIKDIEDLQMPGNESLVNKAKFEEKVDASTLAIQIIKAEKERGQNFLQNRQEDAQSLTNFTGSTPPEQTETEEQTRNNLASNMASLMNKRRGGIK